MAQNSSSPSLVNFLANLFRDEDARAAYEADPGGVLDENGLGGTSPADVTEAVSLIAEQNTINNQVAIDNNVQSSFNVDQGSVGQVGASTIGSAGASGGGGAAGGGGGGASAAAFTSAPPPPPPAPPGTPPQQAVIQSINHYVTNITNIEDNDTSIIDDRDTTVDSSINQTILADGDVNQTFDNDTVTASGDGAVAAGEDAEGIATGDGAVAAGDDIEGAINTGNFEGTQVGGDNDGDIQTVTGNVSGTVIGEVDDSNVNFGDEAIVGAGDVGAASFGNGDAVDFGENNDLDNVAVDGNVTEVDAGGGNVNLGGNQAVDQSTNTDASINDSFNQDNDATVTTTDSGNLDASTNDSFNVDSTTDVESNTDDSFNTDASSTVQDSGNLDADLSSTDSHDTAVDIDAQLEQTAETTTVTDSFNDAEITEVDIEADIDGDAI